MNNNEVLSNIILIVIVLAVCIAIFYLTKWLLTKKYVKDHAALQRILEFINVEAEQIAERIMVIPPTDDKDMLKKEMIATAVSSIKDNLAKEVKTTKLTDSEIQSLVEKQVGTGITN